MASAEGMVASNYSYLSESIESWPAAMGASSSAGDFSILHELNMVSEKFDSPASSLADLPLPPPPTAAVSRKRRPDTSLPLPAAGAKRQCQAKPELMFATEPVTPSYSANKLNSMDAMTSAYFPTSPLAQSMCSEEDDDRSPVAAVVAKPAPSVIAAESTIAFLPTPSKSQAAQRRAMRLAHLKRSRTKKECGTGPRTPPVPTKAETELLSMEQPDKKAARAIRNRAAAMKSRVEAKQKMFKLEQDNERLTKTVDDLTASNKLLAAQIKALTSSLCPGPMTPQRQAEILALTAQFHGGRSS